MININDLTVGQLKEILALNIGNTALAKPIVKPIDPLVEQYVIIRTYSAGVHAGFLVEQNGGDVLLKDSRRLWSWSAKQGVALSGVAVHGLKSGCKVDEKVSLIRLTNVIETILCSEVASDNIRNY